MGWQKKKKLNKSLIHFRAETLYKVKLSCEKADEPKIKKRRKIKKKRKQIKDAQRCIFTMT